MLNRFKKDMKVENNKGNAKWLHPSIFVIGIFTQTVELVFIDKFHQVFFAFCESVNTFIVGKYLFRVFRRKLEHQWIF